MKLKQSPIALNPFLRSRSSSAMLLAAACALSLAAAGSASAADFNWAVNAATNNWSRNANWNAPLVASDTSDLFFGLTDHYNPNNTFAEGSNFGSLTFSGTAGGIYTINGNGLTLTRGISSVSSFRVSVNTPLALPTGSHTISASESGNLLLNGPISGAGDVVKAGAGTVALTGANTYEGLTTVSTGILSVRNATGLGSAAAGTVVEDGATLDLQGNITIANEPLTLNGNGVFDRQGALRSLSGDNTYEGPITLASSSRLQVAAGSSLVVKGTITSANQALTVDGTGQTFLEGALDIGRGNLNKRDTGTLTVSGSSSFSGDVNVYNGVLKLGSGGTFGQGPLGNTSGSTYVEPNATLDLNGVGFIGIKPHKDNSFSFEFVGLRGEGFLNQGALTNSSPTPASFLGILGIDGDTSIVASNGRMDIYFPVVALSSTDTLTLDGTTAGNTINGLVGGAGLLKKGSGTWELTGDSDTGLVSVAGGTLIVGPTGSLSAVDAIDIQPGATLLLSGDGGIDVMLNTEATLRLDGGTLSLAGMNTSLDQTLGALTLSAASVIDFGLLTDGNTLRFADSSAFSWTGSTLSIWNWTAGEDHLFFGDGSGTGLLQDQLDKVLFFSGENSGFLGSASFIGAGELAPVPEPSTAVAALGLLGLAALRRRRA